MNSTSVQRLTSWLVPLVLFLGILAVYLSSRDVIHISDSQWSTYAGLSLLHEGNLNLNEYESVLARKDFYGVQQIGEQYLYSFPIGSSLVAVPILWLYDLFSPVDLFSYFQANQDNFTNEVELTVASIVTAVTAVIIYLIGRCYLSRSHALFFTLVFAFCTATWSTTSRGLWQHGPSMLMLAITLYLTIRAQDKPALIQFTGFFLAFSFVIRPTNSIPVFCWSIYVFIRYRKYFLPYLLWAAVVAVPFLLYNWNTYHTLLAPYYLPQRLGSNSHFAEALAGNLLSPARGLLIYSPFFVLLGFVLVPRIIKRKMSDLEWLLLTIILLHWMMSSSFAHWWGGHSYGPRFFADMLPFLMFLLLPLFRGWGTDYSPVLHGALLILVALGLFVNARGALVYAAGIEWNWEQGSTANVDADPSRLWDWSDPPFLRGLVPGRLELLLEAPIMLRPAPEQVEIAFSVAVQNPGHSTVNWKVETPERIHLNQQGTNPDQQLLPFSVTQLPFVANVAGLPAGLHSLGAIHIAPIAEGDAEQRNEVLVLPVSVMVGAETAVSQNPTLPSDILVNGAPPTAAENQLYALFGSGWFDRESLDNYAWRWASSPATVLVYAPVNMDILLQATAVSLFTPDNSQTTTFTIIFNDQPPADIPATLNHPFTVSGQLHQGWNRILIESQAGSFRPAEYDPENSDMRPLSFAVDNIQLLTP